LEECVGLNVKGRKDHVPPVFMASYSKNDVHNSHCHESVICLYFQIVSENISNLMEVILHNTKEMGNQVTSVGIVTRQQTGQPGLGFW
jgi:hypothetical protein